MKKNSVIELVRDIDCSKTGGPIMRKGTKGVVNLKKRDGTIWIQLEGFGTRHLNLADVREFTGYTVISHPL